MSAIFEWFIGHSIYKLFNWLRRLFYFAAIIVFYIILVARNNLNKFPKFWIIFGLYLINFMSNKREKMHDFSSSRKFLLKNFVELWNIKLFFIDNNGTSNSKGWELLSAVDKANLRKLKCILNDNWMILVNLNFLLNY